MKKKLAFIIIIAMCVGLIFNIGTISQGLSYKEKVDDFNYLYNIISENYGFSSEDSNWLDRKDEFIKSIRKTNSDESFFEKLSYILKDIDDAHVIMFKLSKDTVDELNRRANSINNIDFKPNFNESKTIEMLGNDNFNKRYCSGSLDKIYNKEDNFKDYEPIITKDIVNGEVGYIYLPTFDGDSIEKDKVLISNYVDKIINYKSLVIDVRGNSGGQTYYWKEMLLPVILNKTTSYKYYSFYKNGEISKEYLEFTYGINSQKVKCVDNSTKEILKNLPQDINGNYPYYLENNITVETTPNSKNFNGNIYLLIDEDVYSASDEFVNFCKKTHIATIVGTKTNGGGFGPAPIGNALPNSGFGFGFTLGLTTDNSGDINSMNKTEADIYVEDTLRKDDFKYDKCIKKVLEIEGKR